MSSSYPYGGGGGGGGRTSGGGGGGGRTSGGGKGGGGGTGSKGGGSSRGEPSSYSITKPFGGYYGFAAAYGMKPGEEEDIDATIQAFKDADRQSGK